MVAHRSHLLRANLWRAMARSSAWPGSPPAIQTSRDDVTTGECKCTCCKCVADLSGRHEQQGKQLPSEGFAFSAVAYTWRTAQYSRCAAQIWQLPPPLSTAS